MNKSVYEGKQMVSIPASVFRFCGYDAVTLKLKDKDGAILTEQTQMLVAMDAPMDLNLNGGEALEVKAGEEKKADLKFNTTAFIEHGNTVYTVADPEIAEVDENGTLMGLENGTTTLTATLLPSGRSVEIPVTVTGGSSEGGESGGSSSGGGGGETRYAVEVPEETANGSVKVSPEKAATGTKITISPKPDEGYEVDQVTVTGKRGNTIAVTDNKDGTWSFYMPSGGASVNVTFKPAGSDGTSGSGSSGGSGNSFVDVPADAWFAPAVTWAVEKGITLGTTETTFSPLSPCVRSQIVTFLYRYEQAK